MGLGDSPIRMELGIKWFRRSLRKTASIPVWLRNEKLGPVWEEETDTQDVSRNGAGLRCRHLVQPGKLLVLVRRDNGQRANARVRYSQRSPKGERRLGIEFIDNDNFWDLDWNSPEPEPPLLTVNGAQLEVTAEALPGPAGDFNPVQPGDTSPRPASIQEAIEVVEIASVFATDDIAADNGQPPAQAEAESVKLAPSPVSDDSAAETSARGGQEVAEVVQIGPPAITDDSAAETSAPPALEEAEDFQIAPGLILDESTADSGSPSVQQPVEVVEIAPVLATDDSAADMSAPPARTEAEGAEIAPCPVTEDSATNTSAPAAQEATEVIQIALPPVIDDNAAETTTPPVQAEAESVESAPGLTLDGSTAGCSASPVEAPPERDLSQSLPVAGRDEEPLAPSMLDFYGLGEQPFDVTPDPEYLYLSPSHREALSLLAHGIHNLRGFMALISPPGLGKTTLLNKLMDDLRDSARVVFLFQTQCNSRELLRYLLAELGVEEAGKDAVGMHKALNEILFQEMLKGRRFVLIVDEAQNLQDAVLETVRLLSDFETTHSKLIQIVLSGQPQLAETLKRPNLAQLRQRIAVLANLKPLSVAEAGHYIHHRLRAAGANGKPIFTPDALTLIGERSNGIPRMINNLCFNALLLGHSEGGNPIDSKIVRKAVEKSDWESLARQFPAGNTPR